MVSSRLSRPCQVRCRLRLAKHLLLRLALAPSIDRRTACNHLFTFWASHGGALGGRAAALGTCRNIYPLSPRLGDSATGGIGHSRTPGRHRVVPCARTRSLSPKLDLIRVGGLKICSMTWPDLLKGGKVSNGPALVLTLSDTGTPGQVMHPFDQGVTFGAPGRGSCRFSARKSAPNESMAQISARPLKWNPKATSYS